MFPFGVEVLTRASLTSPSTTLCAWWLDACVPHQRTTYLFYQALYRLSSIKREPHCLLLVVPRSMVIYSMIGSRPTLIEGIDILSQHILLCLLLWNYSEMQANWAPLQQDGRTTGEALSGGRALLVCIHFDDVDVLPSETGLPRPVWVWLNCLRTGVGLFRSWMHKWGMASTTSSECGSQKQTADHTITLCPKYRYPNEIRCLLTVNESLAK